MAADWWQPPGPARQSTEHTGWELHNFLARRTPQRNYYTDTARSSRRPAFTWLLIRTHDGADGGERDGVEIVDDSRGWEMSGGFGGDGGGVVAARNVRQI